MQNLNTTYNVLIVEDNPTISQLIFTVISKNKQIQVQIADKIKWARQALQKTFFDLICLDILLPDGNGLEFFLELKNDPTFKDIKFIIISQKKSTHNIIEALELGVDDYLPKPFHPHELEVRVKKALGLVKKYKHEIKYKSFSLNQSQMILNYQKYNLPLTQTEFLLLQYLFEHEGFANLQVLAQYLSSKRFMSVNNKAVIVSIKRLRDKLRKNTGNPFIKTKYGVGYYIP
jgi:DNA-binding response OmpR family regulator